MQLRVKYLCTHCGYDKKAQMYNTDIRTGPEVISYSEEYDIRERQIILLFIRQTNE